MDYKQNNFTGFIQKQISFRDWLIVGNYVYSIHQKQCSVEKSKIIRARDFTEDERDRIQNSKGKIQPKDIL